MADFLLLLLYDIIYNSDCFFKKLSVCADHVCSSDGPSGFLFGSSDPADIKRNSRGGADLDFSSFAGSIYGKSTDYGEYYCAGVCFSDTCWHPFSRDIVE